MPPTTEQESPPQIYPSERGIAVLSHLSNMFPLWGLIANALIYFAYRERSRAICFHARQGINLQIVLLLFVTLKLSADIVAKFLAVAVESRELSPVVRSAGDIFLMAIFVVYAVFCFYGVLEAAAGRFFLYPYIGKKLLRGYLRVEADSGLD